MKIDKRTLFPFGANLMTPLQRLRDAGLTVRYVDDGGKPMIDRHLFQMINATKGKF